MITVELDNFSLKEICQSGQCFRMRETEENTYELIAGDQYLKLTQEGDRKSTRLNSSHNRESRMPSSA